MICTDPVCTKFHRLLNDKGYCDGKRLFSTKNEGKIFKLLIARRDKAQDLVDNNQKRLDEFAYLLTNQEV
ncbi:MAG: hypothetical protein ACUZ8H_15810 [Candidatus Anammoxibacter sp.]